MFAPVDRDDSLEDGDDDKKFVVISPMIKAYNHKTHNERLSLSNDFLSNYNFVDVQGTTHWGYETDDQFQEHKVHKSGAHEGKFGWTSPEGSEVKIKYIADHEGYRVISSTGLYTKEDDEVLRQKEMHLAEHERAKDNHHRIKNLRNNKKKFGVPLSATPSVGPQGSTPQVVDPTSGSGGFVIVRDDDDFPLAPISSPGGTAFGSDSGVPLPSFTGENVPTRGEVGVSIDSSQSGVPLPTHSQGESTGFEASQPDSAAGIPLAHPTETLGFERPTPISPTQGFPVGIPLPDPSLGVKSDESSFSTNVGLGDSHQDPSSSFSPHHNVGVPLPDPTATLGSDRPTSFSPDQDFGVGIPFESPTAPSGSGRPSTSSTQEFGIPLPDHTLGIQPEHPSHPVDIGSGAALPDSTRTSQPDSSQFSPDQGTGDFSPSSTAPADPNAPTSNQGFGIPLSVHPGVSSQHDSSPSQFPGFSVPEVPTHPDFHQPSNNQEFGVSLPGPTESFGSGASTPTADHGSGSLATGPDSQLFPEQPANGFANEGFGIPLGGAASPITPDQPSKADTPASTGADQELFGVPFPSFGGPPDRSHSSSHPSDTGFDLTSSIDNTNVGDSRFPQETNTFSQDGSRPSSGIPLDLFNQGSFSSNDDLNRAHAGPPSGIPTPTLIDRTEAHGIPSHPGGFGDSFGIPLSPGGFGESFGTPSTQSGTGEEFGIAPVHGGTSGDFGLPPSQGEPGESFGSSPTQGGASESFGSSSSQGETTGESFGSSPTQEGAGESFGSSSSQGETTGESFGSSPTQGGAGESFGFPSSHGETTGESFGSSPTQGGAGESFGFPSSHSETAGESFGISPSQGGAGESFGSSSSHGDTGESFGISPSQGGAGESFGSPSSHGETTGESFGISPSQGGAGESFGSPTSQSGAGESFGSPSSQGGTEESFGIPFSHGEAGESFGSPTSQGGAGESFGIPISQEGTGESFGSPSSQGGVGDSFGFSTSQGGASESFGIPPPAQGGFGNSFGIPLNFNPSHPTGQPGGSQGGTSENKFFILPENEIHGSGTGASHGSHNDQNLNSEINPTSLFGGIIEESIKGIRGGGSSSPQGDPSFNPSNVGIPLSDVNSFHQDNSFSNHQENSGVSLFNNISPNQAQNPDLDLLQGPPVEELDPSIVHGGNNQPASGLDPCQNGKLHPALLPPECFDKAPLTEPSQNIGKSLRQTRSKDEPTRDSFIVVVNSDIFQ